MGAILKTACAGAAGVLALLGIAAHGGRASQWLDVLSHFAPFGLALSLTAAAASSAGPGRYRRLVLAGSAVGAMAWGALMAPEYLRDMGPQAPPSAAGQVKVIQLNALRANADIRPLVDWLIGQDPDIVTISEARHDLRDLLMARSGWKAVGVHSNLMIFTSARRLRIGRPHVEGAKITFINSTYPSASGPLEVVTTHLGWPTDPEASGQARVIAAVVAQLPRERMILTGDFNATPWSARLRRLDDGLGLIRRNRAVATWPAQVMGRPWPMPFLPIDHVYAGPGWATVKVERGPWLGSDHYPLVVTLAPVAPR